MNAIVKAHNVFKWFSTYRLKELFHKKNKTLALNNLSFSLENNTIVGLLGPNGAGKTTLLKLIATLLLPDKGMLSVKQYTTGKDDTAIKAMIGLVDANERSFYWRLTGKQNLLFFATLYGLRAPRANQRLDKLSRIFDIQYLDRRFDTYSTGMKRKCALIRALLHNPDLILFDEPTKSLDYDSAQELAKIMKTLKNEGKTILLATHNIDEAQNICDQFLLLAQGTLCGSGNLAMLRKKINNEKAELSQIYTKLTKHV